MADNDVHVSGGGGLDDNKLMTAVSGVRNELVQINDNLREENQKRDRRIAQNERVQHQLRWLAIGALLLAAAGIFVGLVGLTAAVRANHAVNRANTAVHVSTTNDVGGVRWAACEQFNKQQQTAVIGSETQLVAFAELTGRPLTETERVAVHTNAVAAFRPRDCTTAGIAAYLAHP